MRGSAQAREFDARAVADARGWHIDPRLARFLVVVPFVATVALILTVPVRSLYFWLVDEDHVIEWTQFFFILIASFALAWVAVVVWRRGDRRLALAYAVAAIGAFVVAGEEISWGQRLLGFATPAALEPVNHQGEANVHNIRVVQRLVDAAELFIGLYGVIVPLLWTTPGARAWLRRWIPPIVVPPLCLVPMFGLMAVYRGFRDVMLPDAGRRITEFAELPELALYTGILVTALATILVLRASPGRDPEDLPEPA